MDQKSWIQNFPGRSYPYLRVMANPFSAAIIHRVRVLGFRSILITGLLLCFLFFSACNKNGSGSGNSSTIYIVGNIEDTVADNFNNALQWQNGVASTVSTQAMPWSIFVSGNDVYIAGSKYENENSIAMYWKNGVAIPLTDTNTSKSASANAIYVSGSDVYVAGYELLSNEYGVAMLWKNGVPVNLTPVNAPYPIPPHTFFYIGTGGFAAANSIFVSGTDVYVAGVSNFVTATYWKNGVATYMPDSNLFSNNNPVYANVSYANGIALSGQDVYVVGGTNAGGVYWKNGLAIPLSPLETGGCNSIYVSGTDVYIAGILNYHATYWKNGTPFQLSSSNTSYANSIFVLGNDVYVAGMGIYSVASFWKNGGLINLSPGQANVVGGGLAARSIFVK
jgi:hypothetical protein